jgi:type 2 lantibiotic biosynthesis protein LanM
MTLTREISAEIVASASTFEERLSNGYLVAHPTPDEHEINRRLDRWRAMAAKGDSQQFEKLLAMRGLDASAVRKGLGKVLLPDSASLPDWIELLRDALKAAASWQPGSARFLDAKEPWPFEQIVAPFVEAARERLRASAGAAYSAVPDEAHAGLERRLLYWLVNICSASFILEFSIFRLNRQPIFGHRLAQLTGDTSSEVYREYAQRMLGGGLLPFFREYSVLARAVGRLVGNWVDSTGEFLVRLSSDLNSLEDAFHPNGEIGRIERVAAGLSDPHRGGRSVISLTFSSGLKLVYKPKSLETEVAYSRLLEWLNGQGISLPIRGVKVLSRPDYGWVEFVEHAAPAGDAERVRFYRRSGMLLGLFYALETTDVHAENLIAVGEYPMLVDAETLLTPSLEDGEPQQSDAWAERLALRRLTTSVLHVGMLPWWRVQADGVMHDPSALGGVGGEEVTGNAWQGVDTDSIGRQAVKTVVGRNQNVPFAADEAADLGRYVEEVVAGFREMYELLLAHRLTLLGDDSPLNALGHAPMRLVFRDTATYFTLLKNSMDASVLRDGADRSLHFEVLSRALLVSPSNERFARFLGAEKQALNELDIPFFTLSPQSRSLSIAPGETIENCFPQSAYARVRKRFEQLGAEDLEQQIGIIRGSFWAKIASRQNSAAVPAAIAGETPAVHRRARPSLRRHAPTSSRLIEEAVNLARSLQRQAVRGSDGSVTWLGLVRRPKARNYSFGPVGLGVPDGLAGVALFLAALENATHGAEFGDTALGTLKPIRRALESYEAALRAGTKSTGRDLTLGGAGLGSVAYAFTRIGGLLREDAPLEIARIAASLIKPELFGADTNLDVESGVAGAILGLLSLHKARCDSSVLVRAVGCGDHILKRHTESGENGSRPPALAGELGADFGCGPAGVGYALMRLYRATREQRFLQPASELLAAGPDVKERHSANGNGFARTGLSWLGHLAAADDSESHPRIETALRCCLAASLDAPDQVACGLAGRWDFLLEASELTSRPELLDAARKQAGFSIDRARRDGGYRLHPELPSGIFLPGFVEGISGIGYEFLRLALPGSMPSVLLWN